MSTLIPLDAPLQPTPPEAPPNPESEELKAIFAQMSTESSGLKTVVSGALTDVVADWLVAQFAKTARAQLNAAENEAERWKLLRLAANDLSRLRRGDHSAGWLALRWARFEEEVREINEERWKRDHPEEGGLTMETLEKIERELGLFPEGMKEKWDAINAAREAKRAGSAAGESEPGMMEGS